MVDVLDLQFSFRDNLDRKYVQKSTRVIIKVPIGLYGTVPEKHHSWFLQEHSSGSAFVLCDKTIKSLKNLHTVLRSLYLV